MANKKDNKKDRVAAIVPAYNEADRISGVLSILCGHKAIDEVIVVDDGSSDKTLETAAGYPVRLLRVEHNMGKGGAMEMAANCTTADILFFCDADVKGLHSGVIDRTLEPVLRGEKDMVIAMRNRKIFFLRSILFFIPLLGGERAVRRELWRKIPPEFKHRFRVEAALNFYSRWFGFGFTYIVFRGLTQTIKEKKYGFIAGFTERIKMFVEVSIAHIILYLDLALYFLGNKKAPVKKLLEGNAYREI